MKKILLIISLLIVNIAAIACPLCEKQQPKILQGISHGRGPDSNWDYLIVAAMSLIVLVTLFYSFKMLVKPGENNRNHIKRTVLN